MDDPIVTFVYDQDNNRTFFEYEHLLCGIFFVKSYKQADTGNNTFHQLSKEEFINILREINLLVMPKKKSPEEEKKEKEAREKQASGQPITPE